MLTIEKRLIFVTPNSHLSVSARLSVDASKNDAQKKIFFESHPDIAFSQVTSNIYNSYEQKEEKITFYDA